MSISDPTSQANDFERWLPAAFAEIGAFTALVVLVDIGETRVTPLCSTYFNVIGDEVDWSDIVLMFAGSGRDWDGAAFFPVTAEAGGPLDNPFARLKLHFVPIPSNHPNLVDIPARWVVSDYCPVV